MSERRGISRRAFLGAAAGSAAALGVGGLAATGGLGSLAAIAGSPAASTHPGARTYPFAGSHQAGIVTPAQDRMYTAAYDLTTSSRDELVALLRTWTTVAARLTAGLPAGPLGPTSGPYDAPPDDTGEALELGAAGLTITIGFGRSLFLGPAGAPGPVTGTQKSRRFHFFQYQESDYPGYLLACLSYIHKKNRKPEVTIAPQSRLFFTQHSSIKNKQQTL